MRKKIVAAALCLLLILSFTACKQASEVAPNIEDVVISDNSGAGIAETESGDLYVENLGDGGYLEWIIDIDEKDKFDVDVEYATPTNADCICNVELYAENGKLKAEKKLTLKGTASPTDFTAVTEEMGELEPGRYAMIFRPDNLEARTVNVKSVKLIP